MFGLLYADPDIGQIVASSQFNPIKIVGVTGTTIYRYYVRNEVWKGEPTKWGDAKYGSLNVEMGQFGLVSGIAVNGNMFWLWGSFDLDSSDPKDWNFNYVQSPTIKCASKPTIVGDWTGAHAGLRGTYCPGPDRI